MRLLLGHSVWHGLTLQAELQSLRAELASIRAELASSKSELNSSRSQLAAVKPELAAMKSELATARADLDAERSRGAAAMRDLGAAEVRCAGLAEQLARLQDAKERSEHRALQLQLELAAARGADGPGGGEVRLGVKGWVGTITLRQLCALHLVPAMSQQLARLQLQL